MGSKPDAPNNACGTKKECKHLTENCKAESVSEFSALHLVYMALFALGHFDYAVSGPRENLFVFGNDFGSGKRPPADLNPNPNHSLLG